jgi:hypothetical protein
MGPLTLLLLLDVGGARAGSREGVSFGLWLLLGVAAVR